MLVYCLSYDVMFKFKHWEHVKGFIGGLGKLS